MTIDMIQTSQGTTLWRDGGTFHHVPEHHVTSEFTPRAAGGAQFGRARDISLTSQLVKPEPPLVYLHLSSASLSYQHESITTLENAD